MLEQLRALEMGLTVSCLVRDYDSISIDTQKDLDNFRSLAGKAGL